MNGLVGAGLLVYFVYLFAVTMAPFNFQWSGSVVPRFHSSNDFSKYDLAANLFLFLPFGFLMRGLRPGRPLSFGVLLLSAASVSSAIEGVQLFLPERYTAPHDIVTNVVGAAIGFFLADHALQCGWVERMIRDHVKIAAAGLFSYAVILLFIAVYPRIARFQPTSPLAPVFHWILRATPARSFHPTAQAFFLFLTFWPIGVLLALSLGASSWARLGLATGVIGVWFWVMQNTHSRWIFSPFAWGGMRGTTLLAPAIGLLCGRYLSLRLSKLSRHPTHRPVAPS